MKRTAPTAISSRMLLPPGGNKTLEDMPAEVLLKIFSYCGPDEWRALATTSRRLRGVCSDPRLCDTLWSRWVSNAHLSDVCGDAPAMQSRRDLEERKDVLLRCFVCHYYTAFRSAQHPHEEWGSRPYRCILCEQYERNAEKNIVDFEDPARTMLRGIARVFGRDVAVYFLSCGTVSAMQYSDGPDVWRALTLVRIRAADTLLLFHRAMHGRAVGIVHTSFVPAAPWLRGDLVWLQHLAGIDGSKIKMFAVDTKKVAVTKLGPFYGFFRSAPHSRSLGAVLGGNTPDWWPSGMWMDVDVGDFCCAIAEIVVDASDDV